MRNLPLHDFAQNRIWLAVVQLAMELTAWMQLLALNGTDGRRWEPKRLRIRLLWIAGKLARKSRRTWLMLSRDAPWISMFTAAAGAVVDLTGRHLDWFDATLNGRAATRTRVRLLPGTG